jgi:hypothetical protein
MLRSRAASLVFLFFLISSPTFLNAETQKATLSYFKGSISIFRKQTLVYPEINMRIYAGDSITTASESTAEITYEDASVSSILPNSVLKVGQLKKENGFFTTKIKTWVGGVFCKVQKLRKGDAFQVYTPTAVATVRGTVFEATVSKDEGTSFNVLSGELLAKSLIEGAKTYLLKDKFKYFVGKDGLPDVRKMTEQEVQALQNRAKSYIRGFIEEKKEEIEKTIGKEVKKGCLGFF